MVPCSKSECVGADILVPLGRVDTHAGKINPDGLRETGERERVEEGA